MAGLENLTGTPRQESTGWRGVLFDIATDR